MIVIYTAVSCVASRRAISWFKRNRISYIERKISNKNPLTKKELKDILVLTDNGWEDILCFRSNCYKKIKKEFEGYTFEKAVDVAIRNPTLVRNPIITNGKIIKIGFNEDVLRSFIPKKCRKKKLMQYYSSTIND